MRSSRLILRFSLKVKRRSGVLRCSLLPLETTHQFHTVQCFFKAKKDGEKDTDKNQLMTFVFENADEKKKEAYLDILRIYVGERHRRGDLTFIRIALKYMESFGVHKDLESYKALLNILPKGPYVATNYYQAVMKHYPKHQDVAVELLEQMECNRVIPDREMEIILLNTFGRHALPLKKLWRMLYWMPKFAYLNPWPVPKPIPSDPKALARIAIRKISSVDPATIISEFETTDIEEDEEHVEDTWIISAMSYIQKDLLTEHHRLRRDKAIYVEGPFKVWVADQSLDYFVLRGSALQRQEKQEDIDDVSDIKIPFWKTKEVIVEPTVHEQEDGIYFAVCATGTSSKNSAASWIRCLQKDNPVLKEIPVLIKLASSVDTEVVEIKDADKNLETNVNYSK